jgi:hypothetical protein
MALSLSLSLSLSLKEQRETHKPVIFSFRQFDIYAYIKKYEYMAWTVRRETYGSKSKS